VGDDDQTIFGFNGSNHENFQLFRTHYPAFTELRLQRNYRSSGVIVEAARAVIQNNKLRSSKNPQAVGTNSQKSQHMIYILVIADMH
jgi:DNA helicase II / ATP-dependent DNA helicase PcrA